jgi:Flp pilus assembly pilin Flp
MLQVDNRPKLSLRARPAWYVRLIMVSFRTVLLTLLFAALGMGVGLLVGIIATVVIAAIHHVQPDMSQAYRCFAIPLSAVCGAGAFLWNVIRGVKDAFGGRTPQV